MAEVIDRGRSLDELLAETTDEGSARGLKRSLCYGTLRWHFRLSAILKALDRSLRPTSCSRACAHCSKSACSS